MTDQLSIRLSGSVGLKIDSRFEDRFQYWKRLRINPRRSPSFCPDNIDVFVFPAETRHRKEDFFPSIYTREVRRE